MVVISTFVYFDIETTGLPHQERNRTKIIELSFVAATRNDIIRNKKTIPPISKLTFMLNPQKTIYSAAITGITNAMVKNSPTFKEKFNTIKSFLEDLKKPVCLVAHNGNLFDYKILLAECADANVRLPDDLLCGDSLPYFRQLYKKIVTVPKPLMREILGDGEITDDEDEWPELDVTPEDLLEIDDLCSSMSDVSCASADNKSKTKKPKKIEIKETKPSYKLTEIYKTLLGKEPENAHRAESDCLMLLQCTGACQNNFDRDDFLRWMDDNCKPLNQIKPLIRK